mmetsp:Transcript_29618/g.67908  ORF Transcript_29618/g.67908 Transcript_29618/m.67908 type:complete len:221 (+) Transcript_29618:426-1088(+)
MEKPRVDQEQLNVARWTGSHLDHHKAWRRDVEPAMETGDESLVFVEFNIEPGSDCRAEQGAAGNRGEVTLAARRFTARDCAAAYVRFHPRLKAYASPHGCAGELCGTEHRKGEEPARAVRAGWMQRVDEIGRRFERARRAFKGVPSTPRIVKRFPKRRRSGEIQSPIFTPTSKKVNLRHAAKLRFEARHSLLRSSFSNRAATHCHRSVSQRKPFIPPRSR